MMKWIFSSNDFLNAWLNERCKARVNGRMTQFFSHVLCLVLFRMDALADFIFCSDQDCYVTFVLGEESKVSSNRDSVLVSVICLRVFTV